MIADHLDFLSNDLSQGRSLPGLGGIAVGILAIGVFLQQYNYRYSAIQHGLSNIEYDYLKNHVANSKRRKNGNGNRKRKIDNSSGYGLFSSASNNGYRRRKIDSDNNSSGYGIISAASNAYKVISKWFCLIISIDYEIYS